MLLCPLCLCFITNKERDSCVRTGSTALHRESTLSQLFKVYFLYVSIYINIYNALYARGTIHNNTIGMAHKKQVEKLNST